MANLFECSGDVQGAYEEGYSAGQAAGYSAGQTAGYNSGYSAGQTAGYNSGYSAGYSAGQSNVSVTQSLLYYRLNVGDGYKNYYFGLGVGTYIVSLTAVSVVQGSSTSANQPSTSLTLTSGAATISQFHQENTPGTSGANVNCRATITNYKIVVTSTANFTASVGGEADGNNTNPCNVVNVVKLN